MIRGERTIFLHVVQTGVNHDKIFLGDADYQFFLKLLSKETSDLFLAHCYCLMTNHLHIIIEVDLTKSLSYGMANILREYTLYFNRKYGRVGPLFKGRFYRKGIYDDVYMKNCIKYILKNPERAGICNTWEYKWSSINIHYHEREKDSFVSPHKIRSIFSSKSHFINYINYKFDNELDEFIRLFNNSSSYSSKRSLSEGKEKGRIITYIRKEHNVYDTRSFPINVKIDIAIAILRMYDYMPRKWISDVLGIDPKTLRKYFPSGAPEAEREIDPH